jgi:hypothetical protein
MALLQTPADTADSDYGERSHVFDDVLTSVGTSINEKGQDSHHQDPGRKALGESDSGPASGV